jgi:hypothetical protein
LPRFRDVLPPLCQGWAPIRREPPPDIDCRSSEQRLQPEERGELRAQAFELEKQGLGAVALFGVRADQRVGSGRMNYGWAPAERRVGPLSAPTLGRRLRLRGRQPTGVQAAYLVVDARAKLGRDQRSDRLALCRIAKTFWPHPAVGARGLSGRRPAGDKEPGLTTSGALGPYEFTASTMRGDRYEIRSKLRM